MGSAHRLRRNCCAYCGDRVFPAGSPEVLANPLCQATKDHVLPQIFRAPGNGITTVANIVSACRGCSEVKGPYPTEPFRLFLAETRGTPQFTHAEFRKFIFGLALAGFHAARRDALAGRPPAPEPAPLPAPRGTYTVRDLRRGDRAAGGMRA